MVGSGRVVGEVVVADGPGGACLVGDRESADAPASVDVAVVAADAGDEGADDGELG
jgi:hypothetical protein